MGIGERLPDVRAVAPEGVLLALCWLPYYAIPRPLPEPGTPTDPVWASEFVHDIITGTGIFAIRDPYLRYVPQVAIASVADLFTDLSVADLIVFHSHYTIFLEGVATPLALYWFARTVHSRGAGLGALVGVASLQFLPVWGPWYLSPFWHYAFALPWLVFALLAASRSYRRAHSWAPLVAGVLLGVVGSIQVVQGVYAALIVAIALATRHAWRDLGVVVGVSALVAAPNVVIIRNYLDAWLDLGVPRLRPDRLAALAGDAWVVVAAGVVALLVAALAVRASSATLPPWLATATTRDDWIAVVWVAVSLAIAIVAGSVGAWWYRDFATNLLRYGVCYWVGVVAAPLFRRSWVRSVGRLREATFR